MTPDPAVPPSQPVKPSVVPLLALIFTVVGFCSCLPAPVGVVLAIISLVRSNRPEYAARKILAIVSLAILPVWFVLIGIYGAIAIPAFNSYGARAKQSECKAQLRSAYTQVKMAVAEADDDGPVEVKPFEFIGAGRYLYVFGDQQAGTSSPGWAEGLGIETGFGEGRHFVIGCVGNLDKDETLDVWSVSDEDRTVAGKAVPAGELAHHHDDVTE